MRNNKENNTNINFVSFIINYYLLLLLSPVDYCLLLTITLGFASGNSQLFPGPPESLEPDRSSCCPRDQSLFVYY